jgi:hypothetical protein
MLPPPSTTANESLALALDGVVGSAAVAALTAWAAVDRARGHCATALRTTDTSLFGILVCNDECGGTPQAVRRNMQNGRKVEGTM